MQVGATLTILMSATSTELPTLRHIYWDAYTQISYQNSSSKGKSLNAVKDSRLSQNSSEKDVFFAHVNVIGTVD